MAREIRKIAKALGAEVVGKIPRVGGGAFGAARLPKLIEELKEQLRPSVGIRPGRPTNPKWVRHPKVPMSKETERKLEELAERISSQDRKVSPMQLAARLLEEAVASCTVP
jgi:hypothetical protein